VFMQMLSSGPAWLGIILLITVSLLPDVLKKVLCRQLWPTATERIQVKMFFTVKLVFLYHKSLIYYTSFKVRDKIRTEVPHLWCVSLVECQLLLSAMVKDAAYYLLGGI